MKEHIDLYDGHGHFRASSLKTNGKTKRVHKNREIKVNNIPSSVNVSSIFIFLSFSLLLTDLCQTSVNSSIIP